MRRPLLALLLVACLTNCAAPPQRSEPHITRQRVEAFIVKGDQRPDPRGVWEAVQRHRNEHVDPDHQAGRDSLRDDAYTKIYSTFPVEVVSLIVQLDRRGVVVGFIFTGQDSAPGT